jgi:hypothetical protein
MVLAVSLAVAALGCRDVNGPGAVALQFRGDVVTGPLPALSVLEEPLGFVRIVGGYQDGGCGPIGATAERSGSIITIEIGPWKGGCDLINLHYAYDARLVGLQSGSYTVRIVHRPGTGPRDLAIESQVIVH